MRPGRLDRILYVGPPDQRGREDILQIRTSKMAVDPDLDLSELATLVRTLIDQSYFYSTPHFFILDGWVFRSRDCCNVPGRRTTDYAT